MTQGEHFFFMLKKSQKVNVVFFFVLRLKLKDDL